MAEAVTSPIELANTSAGDGDYTVQPGDCVASIGYRNGLFWQTIWTHPANSKLREARVSPNVLLPGDRLTIPDRRTKFEQRATDKRHKFVRKGTPVRLRIQILMDDDTVDAASVPAGSPRPLKPRANQAYTLTIDKTVYKGNTDAKGVIDIAIPPDADSGKLVIGPDRLEFDVAVGRLDPLTAMSGVQTRLNNLGYRCGAPDGTLNEATRSALRLFQAEYSLRQTSEPDAETRQKLLDVHAC